MNEDNLFARLSNINVSSHIRRRGQFSYLSWPFAVEQLRLADPGALCLRWSQGDPAAGESGP